MVEDPPRRVFRVRANVVDLFAEEVYPGTVVVAEGRIAAIEREPRTRGGESGEAPRTWVLPGFVDAHVHAESAMVPPAELGRMVLPHGTAAMVADPHEIANVLGEEGVEFMLASARRSPMRFRFGAPSCVPATPFETSGAALDSPRVAALLDRDDIGHLSEVMNWPGVLSGDPEVMAKIAAARRRHKRVDGHAPGLRGERARRYAEAGIETDHECTELAEAEEKIAAGMKIAIREGSAAKNLDALLPLLERHPGACFFCTDDGHPEDLMSGHIDVLARRAIAAGYDPLKVLSVACKNPALHYGLEVGLLRPGDRADFIEVDGLDSLRVLRTILGGEVVAERGRCLLPHLESAAPNRFGAAPVTAEALRVPATGALVRVIEAVDRCLFTGEAIALAPIVNGCLASDPARDLLKLVVVNRYTPAPPAVALIRGFGLARGALASSVAHDSHNIVAVGVDDADLAGAINAVIQCRGGLSAVSGGAVDVLPLPIAGLMSDREGWRVAEDHARFTALARSLGCRLGAPYMTLAFMALLVIPKLKLSDKGLFCGERFEFAPLFLP